jgi:hypothetical protein
MRLTWSNNWDIESWSRIDRFLLYTEWEEYFSDATQRRLPQLLSNHFPLMLDCGVGCRASRSFKFENMWLQSEGFVQKVKMW